MSQAPTALLPDLFRRLFAIHEEALSAKLNDSAYHALAAALHTAEAAGNMDDVALVVDTAEEIQRDLDGRRPQHPLSRTAADDRGTSPLFATLASTGRIIATRMHSELVRSRIEARRRDVDEG